MKQFLKILKFEYLNCVKNKAFIITTAVLMGLMIIGSFIPGIIASFADSENNDSPDGEKNVVAVSNKIFENNSLKAMFESVYPDNDIKITDEDIESLKTNVQNQKYSFAVLIESNTSFKYINLTNGIYDTKTQEIYEILKSAYTINGLTKKGLSAQDAVTLLNPQITYETITMGTDITKNYFPSYILMMMLFISITSYGQLVAQSVVSEKNTRTMELLITCAKPTNLMFGKVIGSGLAGLTQLAVILTTALCCFSTSFTSVPEEVSQYINFPVSTVLLALLFFILGYFMFAFLLGAMASFASKSEDLNTLTSPIVFVLTIVYIAVMMVMTSDSIDSGFMVFLSYFPISAPLGMFVRATLADIAAWEIVISSVIQLVTLLLFGILASAIYKLGVLMYGNPPKPLAILKMVRMQKKK